MKGIMFDLDFSQFPEPGLYLLLPDGEVLALTHSVIEAKTREMLDDPEKIPDHVKAAAVYKPCDVCPMRDTAEICHAIMPALPFFDDMDRYMSYDTATAVYREDEDDVFVLSHGQMSDALQFIAVLSLIHYCELGQEYRRFFVGVTPIMPVNKIGRVVFQNVLMEYRGDLTRVEKIIKTMSHNILHTAQCQVARLNLISRRDAVINAFVNAELIFQYVNKELMFYSTPKKSN
jgi:hypothetical protein